MGLIRNLFYGARNTVQANYNGELQKKGVIHRKTKYPIEEEFALSTSKGGEPSGAVFVRYGGGQEKTFSPKNWAMFGAGVLKNTVILKLQVV